MFKHILRITLRNYRKNLLFTLIIVSGLALSMAAIMVISRYMIREYSTDKFHKEYDNLYQAVNVSSEETSIFITADHADRLRSGHPEVLQTCRIDKIELTVNPGTNPMSLKNVLSTDNSFFQLFSFQLINGNPARPMTDDKSIVITESLGKMLFGKRDPLGKVIPVKISEKEIPLVVSAVVKDPPVESRIQFQVLVPFSNIDFHFNSISFGGKKSGEMKTIYLCNLYLLLHNSADIPKLNSLVKQETFRQYHKNSYFSYLKLQPLSDVYFDSGVDNSFFKRGDKNTLFVFLSLAMLLLLLACINYINLTTIKVFSRMKEIAYKKVSGASRKLLIFQFLFESVGLSLVAFLLAVFLSRFLAGFFSSLVNVQVDVTYFYHFPRILLLLVFAVLLGCISGFYPSFLMTRLKSSDLFKGSSLTGRFSLILPKNLFIFQFTIAIALVISAVIIGNQLRFLSEKDPGFKKSGLLHISVPSGVKPFAFRDELLKDPGIEAVSLSYGIPGKKVMTDGKIWYMSGDSAFIPTFGIRMLRGRNFRSTDKDVCLVNETLMKEMKWDDIRGRTMDNKSVIGVLYDFNTSSLREKIVPLELDYNTAYLPDMTVRLKSAGTARTMEMIKSAWNKMVPGNQLDYFFYDDWFDSMYRNEQAFRSLITAFTLIAILISCLGLFGLLTYSIERRSREIGIRKINGAGTLDILLLINAGFMRWVVIAFVIAVPVSVLLLSRWLQQFAYKAALNWRIFAWSGLAAFAMAFITLSWKSWLAARRNPAEVIREE